MQIPKDWVKENTASIIILAVILSFFPGIWIATLIAKVNASTSNDVLYWGFFIAFLLCLPGSIAAHLRWIEK